MLALRWQRGGYRRGRGSVASASGSGCALVAYSASTDHSVAGLCTRALTGFSPAVLSARDCLSRAFTGADLADGVPLGVDCFPVAVGGRVPAGGRVSSSSPVSPTKRRICSVELAIPDTMASVSASLRSIGSASLDSRCSVVGRPSSTGSSSTTASRRIPGDRARTGVSTIATIVSIRSANCSTAAMVVVASSMASENASSERLSATNVVGSMVRAWVCKRIAVMRALSPGTRRPGTPRPGTPKPGTPRPGTLTPGSRVTKHLGAVVGAADGAAPAGSPTYGYGAPTDDDPPSRRRTAEDARFELARGCPQHAFQVCPVLFAPLQGRPYSLISASSTRGPRGGARRRMRRELRRCHAKSRTAGDRCAAEEYRAESSTARPGAAAVGFRPGSLGGSRTAGDPAGKGGSHAARTDVPQQQCAPRRQCDHLCAYSRGRRARLVPVDDAGP